jgi:hypothetical protein
VLAGGDALRRQLDAVGHGIADGLHQRALHPNQHVALEPDVAAAAREIQPLAEAHGGVPCGTLECVEERFHGPEAQAFGGVSHPDKFAARLLDAVGGITFHARERCPELRHDGS